MARSGVRRGMSTGKKSPPTRPQHLDVSSGSDSSGSDSESKEIKRSRTAPSSVHVAQEAGDDAQRKVPLTNIRGRAAGDILLGGAPEFCCSLSTDGLIRIDSTNYPAHWQRNTAIPLDKHRNVFRRGCTPY
ncbi:hypothetical protein ABBQ38_008510 [Trebouxia sp. C0009 RCD-2024]